MNKTESAVNIMLVIGLLERNEPMARIGPMMLYIN